MKLKEKIKDKKIIKSISEKDLDSTEEEELQFKKRRKIIQITGLIVLLVAAVSLTIWLFPYVHKYMIDQTYQTHVQEMIKGFGFGGAAVLALLNAIQIILAVIPGEPIELMAGAMYGPWGGLAVCLIGSTLGTLIVYVLIYVVGSDFAKSIIDLDKYKKHPILNNPKRTEAIMASILLFPGLPKDFIAFIAPFTKVKLWRFLLINAIFRIPSIVSSTFVGNSFVGGNKYIGYVMLGLQAVAAIIIFLLNGKIGGKKDKNLEKN